MIVALGIDPGNLTGFCLWDCKLEDPIDYGQLPVHRARWEIAALMERADHLFVENQYLDRNPKKQNIMGTISLAHTAGAFLGLWCAVKKLGWKEQVTLVYPATWQASLNLKGHPGREQIKRASIRRAISLVDADVKEDAADAMNMVAAMVRRSKSSNLGR